MLYPSTRYVTVAETCCFIHCTFFLSLVTLAETSHSMRLQTVNLGTQPKDSVSSTHTDGKLWWSSFTTRPHRHKDTIIDACMHHLTYTHTNTHAHTGQAAVTARGMFTFTAVVLPKNLQIHTNTHTHTHTHTHTLPFGLTLHGWAQAGGWGLRPSGRAISPCVCTFHSHWTCS